MSGDGQRAPGHILRYIPLTAKRVLEVGCREGVLAAAYRPRNPCCEYVGFEPDADAAREARARIDMVFVLDLGAILLPDLETFGAFDVIVLDGEDRDELSTPQLLAGVVRLLAPHGVVCMSYSQEGSDAQARDLFARLSTAGLKVRRLIHPGGQSKAGGSSGVRILNAERRDERSQPRMHVHVAALAPQLLQVRTQLPAEALQADPSLTVSYVERTGRLPDLPVELDKVAVLQRMTMPSSALWMDYVDRARAQGWVLVCELDDHPMLFEKVRPGQNIPRLIETTLREGCHAVQTSTPLLAQALRVYNPEVAVFENAATQLPAWTGRSEVRKVFYGALNREAFSSQVAEALAPAITAHPELEFVVLHDRAFFDALPTRRKVFSGLQPYSAYLGMMASCDVVLSPLEGDAAELFKSDLKFVEASRSGAAFIASPSVYERTVHHGVTGLIARSMEDWSKNLGRLAADPDLRNAIAKAAWTNTRDHRMLGPQAAARAAWYRGLIARRLSLDAALLDRRRMLGAGLRRTTAVPPLAQKP